MGIKLNETSGIFSALGDTAIAASRVGHLPSAVLDLWEGRDNSPMTKQRNPTRIMRCTGIPNPINPFPAEPQTLNPPNPPNPLNHPKPPKPPKPLNPPEPPKPKNPEISPPWLLWEPLLLRRPKATRLTVEAGGRVRGEASLEIVKGLAGFL